LPAEGPESALDGPNQASKALIESNAIRPQHIYARKEDHVKHFCPDCLAVLVEGFDRFGSPCPGAQCALQRLERAYHADLEDPVAIIRPLAAGVYDRKPEISETLLAA